MNRAVFVPPAASGVVVIADSLDPEEYQVPGKET